jgi:hypothetical protein
MKRAVFAPLEGPELASALSAIARAGLDPAEFVLEERRNDQSFPGGQVAVYKLISVKRLATGMQRQYSKGRGGGWPFEFERDLLCGVFNQPFPGRPGAFSGMAT